MIASERLISAEEPQARPRVELDRLARHLVAADHARELLALLARRTARGEGRRSRVVMNHIWSTAALDGLAGRAVDGDHVRPAKAKPSRTGRARRPRSAGVRVVERA